MVKKKTVGAVASDLQKKSPDQVNVVDLQREATKDYIENLRYCVMHMQKKVNCDDLVKKDAPGTAHHQECVTREAWLKDFYVVVTLKREKVLDNVLRNLFHAQISCPTPTNDQSVFKYHADQEQLEYIWTVPDVETCEVFERNANIIAPEEQPLLQMVLDFKNGVLLKKARLLNGENVEKGIILEDR